MSTKAATVYVPVLPDLENFGHHLTEGLREAATGADGAAEVEGKKAGEKFGEGAARGVKQEAGDSFHKLGREAGEKFSESAKDTMKELGSAVFTGLSVAGIADFTKQTLEAADQLEGAGIKTEDIFGKSAEEVKGWASTMAASFGLTQSAAENAAGTFAQMLRPMGLAPDLTSKMSEKLVQLSQDVARFNNADPAAVQQALISGLKGRAGALRMYGIDLSTAAIGQQALSMGLVTNVKHLTDAQKTQAAYALILKETSNQQGAVARSSHTLKQEQAVLHAEWTNEEATLGTKLMPVLTTLGAFLVKDLVPALSTTGGWVKKNSDWIVPLAAGLGAGVLAFKTLSIAMTAWGEVTKAVTAIQGLFTAATIESDAAMDANPIMLVVVGLVALGTALVVAYEKSTTFRHIVQAVFGDVMAIGKSIGEFFTGPFVNFFKSSWADIVGAWNDFIGFAKKWGPMILAVVMPVIGIPLLIVQHWRQIKTGIVAIWTDTLNWLKSVPGSIEKLFASSGTWLLNAGKNLMGGLWTGIKSAASSAGGFALDIAKDIVNGVISYINSVVIDPLDRSLHSLGAFGVHPFGSHTIPDIPHLATGGMTTGQTTAVIGDNRSGQEAVLPLDSPRTVNALASALDKAINSKAGTASVPSSASSAPVVIAGGELSIAPDSQGRLRAWVSNIVLAHANHAEVIGSMA